MKAHKLLLSLVSPVFRNLFFNTSVKREGGREDDLEKVLIEGPSFTSFQTFIRFLYSGKEEELRDLDLNSLFDIYLLADQYQIRGMKQLIRSLVQELEMKETGLLDIFKVLLKNHANFICEEICADIYRKCLVLIMTEKWWYTKVEAQKYLEAKTGTDPKMKNIVRKMLANFDMEGEKIKQAEQIARKKRDDLEAEMSVDEESTGSVQEITEEIEEEKERPSDLGNDTDSINLRVIRIGGYPEINIRMQRTTKMRKLMKLCSKHAGVPLDDLRFIVKGRQITGGETPKELGLSDQDDVITVIRRLRGD